MAENKSLKLVDRKKTYINYKGLIKNKICGGGEHKKRRCLGPCGEMFESKGKGNRVCPVCEGKKH
jgi:hypothetical protein